MGFSDEAKIFVTIRGYWVTPRSGFLVSFLFFFVEYLLLFCTEEVFFQSEEDWRKSWVLFKRHRSKLSLIRSCCEDGFIETIRREGLMSDRREVIFVGRTVREKGLIELIEAIRLIKTKYPELRVKIVGSALESDRKALDVSEILERHQLDKNVSCIGFVDTPDEMLVGEKTIFCLPSYREGLPRALLEARGRGCFCIVTDIRGCREIIHNGKGGLVCEVQSSSSLASALDTALSLSVAEYDRVRYHGHRQFIKRYSRGRVVARYLKRFVKYG
jgi:glycosyltransferase involved in cell wall biosynthesis